MNPDAEPDTAGPGAFSRGDTQESTTPEELVAWYARMLERKGLA
jgi:hypothetical protein